MLMTMLGALIVWAILGPPLGKQDACEKAVEHCVSLCDTVFEVNADKMGLKICKITCEKNCMQLAGREFGFGFAYQIMGSVVSPGVLLSKMNNIVEMLSSGTVVAPEVEIR